MGLCFTSYEELTASRLNVGDVKICRGFVPESHMHMKSPSLPLWGPGQMTPHVSGQSRGSDGWYTEICHAVKGSLLLGPHFSWQGFEV